MYPAFFTSTKTKMVTTRSKTGSLKPKVDTYAALERELNAFSSHSLRWSVPCCPVLTDGLTLGPLAQSRGFKSRAPKPAKRASRNVLIRMMQSCWPFLSMFWRQFVSDQLAREVLTRQADFRLLSSLEPTAALKNLSIVAFIPYFTRL